MSKNISIIIITNDNDIVLRETLPIVLSQQYDAGFEVVVVRETMKGDIKDILEPFYAEYGNLRSTYLPDKPQYVTSEEIEILLGVKATNYNHIVIIPPSFAPDSENWLERIGDFLESNPLSDRQPLSLGNMHIKHLGFLRRYKHKKTVRKMLKNWCKTNGAKREAMYLNKENAELFPIIFLHQSYIKDMSLRNIIYRHITV